MKKRNRREKTVILTVILAALLAAIYACGLLIPDSAVAGSFLSAKLPPSLAHPFGTDALGRDLLLRTLKGLSVSMTASILWIYTGMFHAFRTCSTPAMWS